MNDDYAVHREGLADAAEPDTWTRRPEAAAALSRLERDGLLPNIDPDRPVPYQLTPKGREATEPDARNPITFIERPPLSYLASLAAEQAERAPEAGS